MCYPWSLAKLSAEVEFKLLHLWLDQIICAITFGLFKIACCRNPVRPALGQHFDPTLIDPVEDAKLVCDGVVVPRIVAAEPVVGDNGCEPVPLLVLLAERSHFDFASDSLVAITVHLHA